MDSWSKSSIDRTPTFYDNGDLYMISAQGGEERALTPNTIGTKEQDPEWSPDRKKIAFITDRNGYDNVAVPDLTVGQTSLRASAETSLSFPITITVNRGG